ncbi:MAG: hypothetical protein JXC85_00890 [Candidatus Aenigmarchaeota archaeon]|nr:hypothetical protein [Candidatus Aenigmarchaeota archaeon]
MSEWVRAAREAKQEHNALKKEIEGYSYKDPRHSESTDESFRRLIADEVNKSRDFLFPMVEAAYIEQDTDDATALEEVMQWLDVFLLELGLPLIWNESADYRSYMKLIRTDVTVIKNARDLAKILGKMNDQVMHGKSGSVVRKCAQLKKYVSDLLTILKRRRHALGG